MHATVFNGPESSRIVVCKHLPCDGEVVFADGLVALSAACDDIISVVCVREDNIKDRCSATHTHLGGQGWKQVQK